MIKIHSKDSTYIKLEFNDENELRKIWNYFSIPIPGAEHSYAVKAGFSDGKQHFIDATGLMYWGLKNKLISFCENNDIIVEDNDIRTKNSVSFEQIRSFSELLDLNFPAYDHQIEGMRVFLEEERCSITAATGSGKSILAYMMLRFALANNLKFMLIVPTISLVYQMDSDIKEYFYDKEIRLKDELKNSKDEIETLRIQEELKDIYKNREMTNCVSIEDHIHCISGGVEKNTDKSVIISTYQSIIVDNRVQKEYFEDIDILLIDEVHGVSSPDSSIAGILRVTNKNSCMKLGMSGSISDDMIKNLTIEGLIGNIHPIINIRELIDLGLATEVVVQPLYLKYDKETTKIVKSMKWAEESTFIRNNELRIEFLSTFVVHLINQGENVVFVYNNNDFGDSMVEAVVRKMKPDVNFKLSDYQKENELNVYYAKGTTKPEKRELFRKLLEQSTSGGLLIGNTKVISTGINIKNLHSLILGQLGKAYETLAQSIGRLTRLHNSKDQVNIYDIVDDARYFTRTGRSHNNYTFNHWLARYEHYMSLELLVNEPKSFELKGE